MCVRECILYEHTIQGWHWDVEITAPLRLHWSVSALLCILVGCWSFFILLNWDWIVLCTLIGYLPMGFLRIPNN